MKTHKIAALISLLSLSCMLVGLYTRLQPESTEPGQTDKASQLQLARFLHAQGFQQIKRVHFTADTGVTGVQAIIPACDARLYALVMPDGDELNGLWRWRNKVINNQSQYLFAGKISNDFPQLRFWWKNLSQAIKARLTQSQSATAPVLALSFPVQCNKAMKLPWHELKPETFQNDI